MAGLKALLFSTCILGLFLIGGKFLRVRVPMFQKLFLPSSIIGGFLALGFGPYGFNVIPDWVLEQWAQFPGVLINVVFASLFLGVVLPKPKQLWSLGGAQLCFGSVMGFGQYLVALLVTVVILNPLFGTPAIFACILEIGFSGGHGTAAGMAPVFAELGLEAGGALGQMSATVGIITAVVIGIVLVNIAIRKGYCTELNEKKGIPEYKKRGLIPEAKRFPISTATVATEAVEPLALHFAVVGVAILIGWLLLEGVHGLHPALASFPLFPMAMMGGMLVQLVSVPLKIAPYYDRGTFDRILGFSLDLLVLSAISSLRLDLFLQNLWPFVILMVAGVAWCVFATMVIAPRMFPKHWFERGISEFGMQTGVTAMGLLLLRLVDPGYKTGTANAFGFKQMVYEPFMGGGLITAMSPFLVVTLGPWPSIGVCAAIVVTFAAISWVNGWVSLRPTRVHAHAMDGEDSNGPVQDHLAGAS
jgi:ESS family glutamate:Na+ symporter